MLKRHAQALFAAALLTSTILAACGGASPTTTGTQGGSPPVEQTTSTATEQSPGGRSLTVAAVEGKVEVRASGASEYTALSAGQALGPGDEIRTGRDGKAILLLDDGTKMVVTADTAIQLETLSGTTESPVSQFFMSVGKVFAVHAGELPDDAAYEIETPSGVATIRGSYIAVVFFGGSKSGTVMCLAGHCQYAPGTGAPGSGQPIPLTGKQGVSFNEGGAKGDIFDLTPLHLQLWSDALDTLDESNVGGISGDVQCTCDATVTTTLICDDGTQYEEFPSCLESEDDTGQVCSCDGTDLVCEDGTIFQDDSDCSESDGEDYCYCDGTTSYCLDGSETEDDPSCSEDNACYCDDTTLVCGDESYEDDDACIDDEGEGEIEETEVPEDEPTETVTEEPEVEPTEEGDVCEEVSCGDGSCDAECGEDSDWCSEDCGGGGEDPTEDPGETDGGGDDSGSGGDDSGGGGDD